MADRTCCEGCGCELWGAAEAHGFCVNCQLRDRHDDGDRLDSRCELLDEEECEDAV